MLNRLSNISINNVPYSEKLDRTFSMGVVADVILDETHPAVLDISDKVLKDTTVVGAIVVKSMLNWKTRDEQFIIAYPLDRNFINLPVKNEIVEIIQTGTGKAYYRVGTPTINPSESANLTNLKGIREWYDKQPVENKSSKYSKVSNTGISKTKGMSNPYDDENYGKYYQKDDKLHRMQLYEGDLLVESRFGQSIRFSAFDNKDKKWYPCITIRNRENDLSRTDKKKGQTTLEDINRDGSIIVMSSLKKVLPFQPGTVNKSNKSDFVTKPISFPNYPKTLDGDQVLVNSGRIILSSKTKEMIFWSKGNTGIISDGHWSWDLAKGITGDIGGNWHVTTNNFDFRVFAGHRGRCILGSGPNLQNIPRGNDLIGWLGELIDLIITNIYYIGPGSPPQTFPGPTNNIPKYLALRARLPRLLSKLNYTGNEPEPSRIGKDQAVDKPLTEQEIEQSRKQVSSIKNTIKTGDLTPAQKEMLLEEGRKLISEIKMKGQYGMSMPAPEFDPGKLKDVNIKVAPLIDNLDECEEIGKKIVAAARADLGVRELPGRNNRSPEIDLMVKNAGLSPNDADGSGSSQDGFAWCASAVYKWWTSAGLGDVLQQGRDWMASRNKDSGYNALTGVVNWKAWAQSANSPVIWSSTPVLGAAVVFSYGGERPDHLGIVASIGDDGTIFTIEGNTFGQGANRDGAGAGAGVHYKKAKMNKIQGYIWPPQCG